MLQEENIAKFCHARRQEPKNGKSKPKLTCFKCKKVGHFAENCFSTKSLNPMQGKMNSKIIRKKDKIQFRKNKKWKIFSFFWSENCVKYQDFIIDSGATNYMIKDKSTFANLDENFSGITQNSNKTHSSILVKGC